MLVQRLKPFDHVYSFHTNIYKDDRGYFFEKWKNYDIDFDFPEFCQDNISYSVPGVFRGLHLQTGDYAQDKFVTVLKGNVIDIIVDVRPDSPTYKEFIMYDLDEESGDSLFIPKGFAHGFFAKTFTIFSYKVSTPYNKESSVVINYKDKEIGLDLNIPKIILSEQDKKGISIKEYEKLLGV